VGRPVPLGEVPRIQPAAGPAAAGAELQAERILVMKVVPYVLILVLMGWLALKVSATVGETYNEAAVKVSDVLKGGRR
jgi:hypothetical protein